MQSIKTPSFQYGALWVLLFVCGLRAADQESAPNTKREKPTVEGTFQYGSKTYRLQHGLAYQNKDGDRLATRVYLTEKPFPAQALKSLKQALLTNGNDEEFFIFDPFFFVAVHIDGETEPSINVMLPDGGGFNITKDESTATVDGDQVKGRLSLPKPEEVFGKQYRFNVKFDLRLLRVAS